MTAIFAFKFAGYDLWGLSKTKTASSITNGHNDHDWAVSIERPGLTNFHKVNENLYRGAQPTAEGMRELKRMGIRTVVNLRFFHSDRDKIAQTGLAYEHIHVNAWHPEDNDVVRFLHIVTDPQRTPVFVHCQYGADRTGAMCAIYRIVVQGWTKEEAIREMTEGGFGYHDGWQNLVSYIQNLDFDRIKSSVEALRDESGEEGESDGTP